MISDYYAIFRSSFGMFTTSTPTYGTMCSYSQLLQVLEGNETLYTLSQGKRIRALLRYSRAVRKGLQMGSRMI